MKKNIAVLGIMTKMSIYKIISVLLLMGVSQIAFAYGEIMQCKKENMLDYYAFYHYINLDILLWIFLGAFLLISLILFWTYGERSNSHTSYFYMHLIIGRNQKCLMNIFYALFCYLLLFGWQIGVVRIIELIFRSFSMQEVSSVYQYISGTYYVDLINGIFNLNEKFVLIVGILFVLLFSIEVSKAESKKKLPISLLLLFVLYAVSYKERIDNEILCIALLIVLSVWLLINIFLYLKNMNNEENMI